MRRGYHPALLAMLLCVLAMVRGAAVGAADPARAINRFFLDTVLLLFQSLS